MVNISQDRPKIPELKIGDGKEEKRVTAYSFLSKIGERILGAFYIKIKL